MFESSIKHMISGVEILNAGGFSRADEIRIKWVNSFVFHILSSACGLRVYKLQEKCYTTQCLRNVTESRT